jgi:hypothetical protein
MPTATAIRRVGIAVEAAWKNMMGIEISAIK